MQIASRSLSFHLTSAAAALLSLLAGGLAPSIQAAPFTNGSFESPGGPPGTDVVLPQGPSTYVTGWTVNSPSANSTVYESGANRQFVAQDGVWVISFGHNGTTGATLSQTFDTVAGASYTINYRISRIQAGSSELSGAVEALDATNSQSLAKIAFLIPTANNTWVAGPALTFTATSASTTLQFRDTTVGGFDSNWALDNVRFGTGAATPTPTPSNTAPKGKLGTTYFGANQFGEVMRFTALITDAAASLKVRVQVSTTPNNAGSWQDLPNGSAGRMTRDRSYVNSRVYVLNSTNFPLQNGLHFRAIASAAGYPDSISEADGPFNFAASGQRAGPAVLSSKTTAVPVNHLLSIRAEVSNDFDGSGVTVRLQSSTTPGDESSWADFQDSAAGTLGRRSPGNYSQSTVNYPTGNGLYFRAIVSRPGYVDSLSNVIGGYDLRRIDPPTVKITSPTAGGGGSGLSKEDPIVLGEGQQDRTHVKFAAEASTGGQRVKAFRLYVDEATVQRVEGVPQITVNATIGQPGLHRLRAYVVAEAGGVAADVRYIRIAPLGGKVFRSVSNGTWHDAETWRDGQGNRGVPGANDVAIVTTNVTLSDDGGDKFIRSAELHGGTIQGPRSLTVLGSFSMTSGELRGFTLVIEPQAEVRFFGDGSVRWGGKLANKGKFFFDGRGEITGDPAVSGGSGFLELENNGQVLLGGGGTVTISPTSTNTGHVSANDLLGNDGSSILANDGASILANDGASIITHDGSSLIGNDGSGIVSGGGGNIVSGGGGNILSNDGASLSFRPPGGSAVARATSGATGKAASAGESFTTSGGVIDLGSSPRLASNLQIIGGMTINAGVVKGTGVIFGDVTQNGGFISPGNSAGAIGIDGNFTQAGAGTIISEIGGFTPAQFDQLVVTGTADVNGKLNVRAINGYAPEPDGTFSLLVYSAGSGALTTSSNAQMTLRPTGLLGTLNVGAPPPPPAKLLNIATRLRVEQGENALIGGFILTGSAPKRVIIRALGPSLAGRGIAGGLADPTLELFTPDGTTFNNNWRDSQAAEIEATSIAPSDEREAAIVATLQPGVGYTAVVRGVNDATGVGLVEVYDLDAAADSTLANISTRGLVQTGENVMIGGLIVGGDQPAKVLVRAIGPSLGAAGVTGALEDPTLELYTADGAVISNDEWRATQEAEVLASTVPPSDEREAAIVATLPPGNYTAIVRGKGDTTGVALVEAYNLQ